ncbi:flavin reductase family protein [Streptomyces sp. NPDC050428]|uniref:flavin reductase family protein n=1 Tax=Streptomyces sp. NPDC050428 TaxID=3155757 RepID=UPI00341B8F62
MTHSTVPRPPQPVRTAPDEQRQRRFRRVMAELPAGVTVLTTTSPHGPVGMTTSAVTSLSMDPMLVLACLHHRSGTLDLILRHQAFVVNVLPDTMDDISQIFAEKPLLERFSGVPHHYEDTVPVLDDALASITCRVHTTYPGGDHTILIGSVTNADADTDAAGDAERGRGRPLVRHRGAYRGLT